MIKVLILNYKSLENLQECIAGFSNLSSKVEIVIIDNGSKNSDLNEIEALVRNEDHIFLFKNFKNLGFTKGYNAYLKNIENASHLFLLNNDTSIDKACISVINKRINTDQPDMLSCKMINYWNRELMDNAGHKMYTSGEIVPLGHARSINKYTKPLENIGACAGAAVYSTAMLNDIGLFDEYFDTGYEDAEFGLRAFIAGYKCIYEPNAIVYHKMGQSIKKIFDFDYVVKIQTNIYYTYLKLVHWQIICTGFIPWLIRLILITLVDIIFWRPKYLRVQYSALYNIIFKDWKTVMKARKEARHLRRISWWKLLKKQEFFLVNDVRNFYKFIIKGEKSYFEKF